MRIIAWVKLWVGNLVWSSLLGANLGFSQFMPTKVFCEEVEALLCPAGGGSCSKEEKTQHKHQCMEFIHPIVEQKAVRYQSANARVCLTALKTPKAAPGARFPAICHQVLEGILKSGQPCEWSISCARPAVCRKPAGSPKGTCGQGLGANELCDQEATSGSLFATELLRQQGVCARGLRCLGEGAGVRRCR